MEGRNEEINMELSFNKENLSILKNPSRALEKQWVVDISNSNKPFATIKVFYRYSFGNGH